ncbi:hypothetical protein ACFFSH_34135 [Streptomyces filamentosus]|uniref:Uncharacterized protein n=1 Tax=Streptomyces filamentosus TaxID=67294 RepID=A0A919BPZ6_STRFL|nr:hypothetical protein [Streptomyces filamentosus]GHG04412.1 hypothetical protein GCM10017667_38650 [Streptomyces filamentosus]
MSNSYTLHISGAPPEWFDKLYELATQLPTHTLTTGDAPTVEAASALYDRVTPDAKHLLRLAVQGNGRALGADFREQRGEGRLNGATTSLARATRTLTSQGNWPSSIPAVLTSTKAGPEGWRKTHAFHMPAALVPVFRTAIHQHDKGGAGAQSIVGHLADVYMKAGHAPQDATEYAQEFLELHADDLAAWLAHRAASST